MDRQWSESLYRAVASAAHALLCRLRWPRPRLPRMPPLNGRVALWLVGGAVLLIATAVVVIGGPR